MMTTELIHNVAIPRGSDFASYFLGYRRFGFYLHADFTAGSEYPVWYWAVDVPAISEIILSFIFAYLAHLYGQIVGALIASAGFFALGLGFRVADYTFFGLIWGFGALSRFFDRLAHLVAWVCCEYVLLPYRFLVWSATTLNLAIRVLGSTLKCLMFLVLWWAWNFVKLAWDFPLALATAWKSYLDLPMPNDLHKVNGFWSLTSEDVVDVARKEFWYFWVVSGCVAVPVLLANFVWFAISHSEFSRGVYFTFLCVTPLVWRRWLNGGYQYALPPSMFLADLDRRMEANPEDRDVKLSQRSMEALARGTALANAEGVALLVAACGSGQTLPRLRRRGRFANRLQHALGERNEIAGRFLRGQWTPDLPSESRTPAVSAFLHLRRRQVKVLGAGTFPTTTGRDGDYVLVESSDGKRELVVLNLLFKLVTYATFRPRDAALELALKSRAVSWLQDVDAPLWVGAVAMAETIAAAWPIGEAESAAKARMVKEVGEHPGV